jgi:quercetin dioxygenase-like cupin family protein
MRQPKNAMLFQKASSNLIPLLMAVVAVHCETSATSSFILDANEGERRIHRPAGTGTRTAPFILKVDPKNSSSKHLILFAEELPPGAAIPRHRHPEAEEILILETGRTRVHLGDVTKEAGPGATVFIPADTWISAEVIGDEPVRLKAIFSEPGFEEYMRAISVREGEPNRPITQAELESIRAEHPHAVCYR